MIAGFEPRRCAVCRCTDRHACVVDGVACHWVAWDLCSACEARALQAAKDAQTRGGLLLIGSAAVVAIVLCALGLAALALRAAGILHA